ncbi:MAG: hypothetical protein Kow0029_06480 [Candidatus Rifleibacteriota bacterium]
MHRNYWVLLAIIFLAGCAGVNALWACSAKGPADPITGLITYPPGTGVGGEKTSVPTAGLEGTPFEGGKFFKGWLDKAMKVIVVPVGTKLAFEGVIQSTTITTRPDYWEEGAIQNLYGTTVEDAPRPTWTITGNGRGDFRDGNVPPTATGFKFVSFESPPSCIIVDDTPAVKALWKLTYDQNAALNMLSAAWKDPLIRASIESSGSLPPDFDMESVLNAAREPQGDDGAKDLNEFEISPTGPDGVEGLRNGLDSALTQRTGTIINVGGTVTRTFVDADGAEFSRTLSENARVIVKAGYIAMQEWYPSGRYNTKYLITPPSGDQYEVGQSRLTLNFETPTAPDYWIVDLNSGLESCKDCVWCWIEMEAALKAEGSSISNPSDIKSFYDIVPDTYAIGGVFVRGYYQSGTSSAGRNTMVYVVVADTEAPAHYAWEGAEVSGKTGEKLSATGGQIKFRVYDNNPVIGANGSNNNIFDVLEGLEEFDFVEASKKPADQAPDPNVFALYLEPVKNGFDEKNLFPLVHYNVCVPAYAGFKVNTPKDYTGPMPLIDDRLVLPLQKFVWRDVAIESVTISDYRIHAEDGSTVSDLRSLFNNPNWRGYSSYQVTVDMTGFTEPMGYGLADNSVNYDLSISDDLKAIVPSVSKMAEGIPVDSSKVHFFGWNGTALKMFVSASDGLVQRSSYPDGSIVRFINRSPNAGAGGALQKILKSNFSGSELSYAAGQEDFVSTWDEPTTVSAISNKLPATIVKGGSLGTSCSLPSGLAAPDGAWGKFNYVSSLLDTGKPNLALEIVNSKNEKAVVYGNLFAAGENEKLVAAAAGAGKADWAHSPDKNEGDKTYTADSAYYSDSEWEFKDHIDTDLYMAMKNSMDENSFKPWLFAFDATAKDILWKSGYWNGKSEFNNDRVAFQQGSRDRLLFRYWAWDNINSFYTMSSTTPNGIQIDASPARERFKSVSGFVTAEVKLVDTPGYGGQVPASKVWWPDYIFHNPSNGSAEECSISLKSKDEKDNERNLKVWFRIQAPAKEQIRTIEDRRNREP